MSYTEANYENAVLELFAGTLGYTRVYGPEVARDYRSPLDEETLAASLRDLNPGLPQAALDEALLRLKTFEAGSLVQKNRSFTDYLQNGVPVRYLAEGEERSGLVYPVDYRHPERNRFVVANQWTVSEMSEKRADAVVFVNGLPLAVVELKSPSREEADASAAYRQLRNYMHEIPSLFVYNQICVMSDLAVSKAGTLTSGEDRFMEWKSRDGSGGGAGAARFETFFEGIFEKTRFLDILRNFICFNADGERTFKILAGYHQYFAVRKAIASTLRAAAHDGKGGVFWHTQGSGKSLSMVFYAHALQQTMESPTVVVITDRNDLDNQLYGQFCRCADFLRQTPVQAESREHLRALLAGREANGIIFTTMQKFAETGTALSARRNIVVMADEAHRGQYGLEEKVVTRRTEQGTVEARTVVGFARLVRSALPNATYIGFTGTPVSAKDRSTREVFGDYIDIYDMTQAVEDGATRPVYYESRVVRLNLDEEALRRIDAEYDRMADEADPAAVEASKRELGQMEAILGAERTVASLVDDILAHYEAYRADLLTGKAMIVAYSRAVAMKIYRRILELRPDWTEKVAVVMTQGNNDPEDWREAIGNRGRRDELARTFKDDASPLKIAIVVDMWLTGFDVPSLATMYVYKPMAGHNLMQAIARVNRVFRDKEGGLVVDYVGIAGALKRAMLDYTGRDRKNYGDPDVGKAAYPRFLEKLSVCRDLFHGFDMAGFFSGSDLERGRLIGSGADFLLGRSAAEHGVPEKERTAGVFVREAQLLRQALSLCGSLADEAARLEAAFYEAVRIMLVRLAAGGEGTKLSLQEINRRIGELLKHSVRSEGVVSLFSDGGEGFSLFDPAFLEEIAGMKEKNLAVELLKRLIAEQVSGYARTSVVKSEKFSVIIRQTMKRYLNGMLTNEQVIEELLNLAKEIAAADAAGERLGLSAEEAAFYDALTQPQAVRDFYSNDVLIAMTRELTEQLRKNRTIDWTLKESARAGMRRLVKRLLKRYRYPPEEVAGALDCVIRQCELWADAAPRP